jgi:hypothetical protein
MKRHIRNTDIPSNIKPVAIVTFSNNTAPDDAKKIKMYSISLITNLEFLITYLSEISYSFLAIIFTVKKQHKGKVFRENIKLFEEDKSGNNDSQSSFYTQYLMNPGIKRPVGHISLSYSLFAMKTGNIRMCTSFNRIGNNGRTVSDQNDCYRSEKICKELTEKYGLYFADGKDDVKLDRLRNRDKTKYEIYHAVKGSLKTAKNWADLQNGLKESQIELKFKYKGQTDVVQGV